MSNVLKTVKNRSYLGRDYDAFSAQLLESARQFFPDKINDFSESGLGGVFLDFAAVIGDNLSYYLDHNFNELSVETAVETTNIEKLLRSAKVKIVGAAPAIVNETFYVPIPAENNQIKVDCLPIIKAGTIVQSNSGIIFRLLEDIDFSEKDANDQYIAQIKIGTTTPSGQINYFILSKTGVCISGFEATETFRLDAFVPFRRITLNNTNIHEIISVSDTLGNKYYQTESLSDDVVYVNLKNPNSDVDVVDDIISTITSPYRFITETSLSNRTTTMILGGGSASTFEDDAIPDPSDFAIPMKYKKTFSRISINPSQLLNTKTLGVSAVNTTLTVNYRYGGGLNHNIQINGIQSLISLDISFPLNPNPTLARTIRDGIEVNNLSEAVGGDDAPSIDDLKTLIPSARNSQERIVSKTDALARLYTMPSNFGRIFRAAIVPNVSNPLATQLYVISRNIKSQLVPCSDTLKKNIRMYLTPYRMISDSIDILDLRIINLQIKFEIFVDPSLNKNLVLLACLDILKKYFNIKNWQADQPINESDIIKTIMSVAGVLTINKIMYIPRQNVYNNKEYSNVHFDVESNKIKNFIMAPFEGGSIFEIRYPEIDIIGKAV